MLIGDSCRHLSRSGVNGHPDVGVSRRCRPSGLCPVADRLTGALLRLQEDATKGLVDMLGRERDALLTYMQEFDADGLVSIYDQPEVNKATDRVDTRKVILWRRDGDRLLEFIADPVNTVRGSGSPKA